MLKLLEEIKGYIIERTKLINNLQALKEENKILKETNKSIEEELRMVTGKLLEFENQEKLNFTTAQQIVKELKEILNA